MIGKSSPGAVEDFLCCLNLLRLYLVGKDHRLLVPRAMGAYGEENCWCLSLIACCLCRGS